LGLDWVGRCHTYMYICKWNLLLRLRVSN